MSKTTFMESKEKLIHKYATQLGLFHLGFTLSNYDEGSALFIACIGEKEYFILVELSPRSDDDVTIFIRHEDRQRYAASDTVNDVREDMLNYLNRIGFLPVVRMFKIDCLLS